MREHHHTHGTRYKKGNGIATLLFTLEWVILAVTGIAGKIFGMENWQFVTTPNMPVLLIASFGGLIASAFIGRWLLDIIANKTFGGDEKKAMRIDRYVMTGTMILWMVLFCIGINEFNKASCGEDHRNKYHCCSHRLP